MVQLAMGRGQHGQSLGTVHPVLRGLVSAQVVAVQYPHERLGYSRLLVDYFCDPAAFVPLDGRLQSQHHHKRLGARRLTGASKPSHVECQPRLHNLNHDFTTVPLATRPRATPSRLSDSPPVLGKPAAPSGNPRLQHQQTTPASFTTTTRSSFASSMIRQLVPDPTDGNGVNQSPLFAFADT